MNDSMDLEAVSTMADNIPMSTADPLGFHVTNEQFLGVDFSFLPVSHASSKKIEPLPFSLFGDPMPSVVTHLQNSSPSGLIDSDDDFGDFKSVPADGFLVVDESSSVFPEVSAVNSTQELQNSFDGFQFLSASSKEQSSTVPVDLFGHFSATVESSSIPSDKPRSDFEAVTVKSLEISSDDDWGDFVEHSTSAVRDNSQAFEWFDTTQHNVEEILPPKVISGIQNGELEDFGTWANASSTDTPKLEAQALEAQALEDKVTKFRFDDFGFFGGGNTPSMEGKKSFLPEGFHASGFSNASNDVIAQTKTPVLQRTFSGQKTSHNRKGSLIEITSTPIPLSLFGEEELEIENQREELADPVSRHFQGHSRSKALSSGSLPSGGGNFSDLIASLYTESQPESHTKDAINMNYGDPKEIKNYVDKIKTGRTLFDNVDDSDGLSANNSSTDQSIKGAESSSLEECLFDLKLCLRPPSELDFLQEANDAAVDASDQDQTNSIKKEAEAKSDMAVAAQLDSQEATRLTLLGSASTDDQYSFVKAWAAILAVCASELEHASNVWKQAQDADAHLALLADLKGKRYFAAIGQIYVVALILATASNFYKPWLAAAAKEGESLKESLERCKAAWLQTDLKEAVRFALCGLEGLLPSSLVPWKGIEGFATIAHRAYIQAANVSSPSHSICGLSLLPFLPFSYTGLPSVQWSGSSYLLPLANMWANCVSHEPLTLPSIQLKEVVIG